MKQKIKYEGAPLWMDEETLWRGENGQWYNNEAAALATFGTNLMESIPDWEDARTMADNGPRYVLGNFHPRDQRDPDGN